MIKVFEAFAGVESQRMALRNTGIDFEVVGISDVNRYVLLAYIGRLTALECWRLIDFNDQDYLRPRNSVGYLSQNYTNVQGEELLLLC